MYGLTVWTMGNKGRLLNILTHQQTVSFSRRAPSKINLLYIVRKLVPYVWPKERAMRARVVGAVGCLLAAKVTTIQTPFIFKLVVDRLNEQNIATVCTLTVAGLVVLYGFTRVCTQVFSDLRLAIFSKVALKAIKTVNEKVFRHLMYLDMSYHANKQTGAVSRVIQRGSGAIQVILTHVVFNMFPLLLETCIVAAILKYKCGILTAIASVSCIASYFVFTLAVTQWRLQFRKKMNESETEAGNKVVECLLNIETIKYFSNEELETASYGQTLSKFQDSSVKTWWSLALLNCGQNLIITSGMTAIMLLSLTQIEQGLLTIGDIVMINGLLFQLSMPLNFLGTVYRDLKQATIDLEALFSLLSMQSVIRNSPSARELILRDSSISFEDVHFGYDSSTDVFRGLSFHIPGGTSAAIVGGSGCGKSTVAKLLCRLYDPVGGRVTIDGQDIRSVTLHSLRTQMSVIPQDCTLFNDSIRNNILYGDPFGTQEALTQAATLAEIDRLVETLPHKYETVVGERGMKLSGGEKQRIAIARALVGQPRIVVCDEATSSLDSLTEQSIARSLRVATAGRTTLVIAHRLSTIMHVDRIFVISEGRVCEQGTHWQLISNPHSLYRRLWMIQSESAA